MSSQHNDVRLLLSRNISKGQLLGYALANVVGLTVILIGLLFYADSKHSVAADDQYFSADYVVISKHVEGIGFTPQTFTEAEIADLNGQPWVKRVGRFTSSRFAVHGEVGMGGRGFSSYLFFEAVPDEFFDIKPRGWTFSPDERFIPIVLSKDYLALYNFGFAVPQGLPQVSEDVIESVPIKVTLTGESMLPEPFEAGIVGFSSRLNTIVVPQSFMEWANRRYSSEAEPQPSRLIVAIDRLAASTMTDYFAAHGYEAAGDQDNTDKISGFFAVVSAVVASGGLIISLLALFILVLSIYLLFQKSRDTLRHLMLLGYHPMRVARYYEVGVIVANLLITAVAVTAALLCRPLWSSGLQIVGLGGASPLPMVMFAVGYWVVMTVLDVCIIRTRMMRIWQGR
jgi:hypothetical protein